MLTDLLNFEHSFIGVFHDIFAAPLSMSLSISCSPCLQPLAATCRCSRR
jgi:hypothetical protein